MPFLKLYINENSMHIIVTNTQKYTMHLSNNALLTIYMIRSSGPLISSFGRHNLYIDARMQTLIIYVNRIHIYFLIAPVSLGSLELHLHQIF